MSLIKPINDYYLVFEKYDVIINGLTFAFPTPNNIVFYDSQNAIVHSMRSNSLCFVNECRSVHFSVVLMLL